jgi:hypothetical protein
VRTRVLAILIFVLTVGCLKACGQGFFFTSPTTLNVSGTGSTGGGGGGGGGTSPGAPTEYWDLNEASGNRIGEVSGTVLDDVGGTINNTASGLYGNAAEWNNSRDLVATVPAYTSGNSISINYWLQLPSFSGLEMPQCRFWAGASVGDDQIKLEQWNGVDVTSGLYVFVDASDYGDYQDETYEQTAAWRMITLVYTGGAGLIALYVDSVLLGESSTPSTIGSQAAPSFFFEGVTGMETARIDEVYFKYAALTSEQIVWMFNSGSGRQYSDY